VPSSRRVVVLFAGGAGNRGQSPIDAAGRAAKAGVRVDTVSIGTSRGTVEFGFKGFIDSVPVPPDETTMRVTAAAGRGQSFVAHTSSQLTSICERIARTLPS
jgi:hypothetical protein